MKEDQSPEKIEMASEDMSRVEVERLSSIFPQFVKDGVVDFDAFKEFFGEEGALAEGGQERYGLSWKGKGDAFKAIRIPATGTLTPQEEESKDWDTTENVFIEGDNLEALKLLQRHYRNKIKMIYIDPPYNTGKDFIYKDNFTENKSDYYERTGQRESGVALTSNPESNGRYHSDWLTMMYPRLFLARQLLRDDGVIFISIDDNEVANLRLIMDEIFGEENLLAQLIHQRAKGGGQAKQVVKGHDYILAYARNVESDVELRRAKVVQQGVVIRNGKEYLRNDDVIRKTFGKYDKSLGDRRCFYEELEQYKGPEKKKEIDDRIARGELFLEELNGKNVIVEYIPLEEASSKLYSIIKVLSEVGKNDLETLGIVGFDYPKPTELVSQLIQSATLMSKHDSDIILDFFAGSGTTAHAVMAQNVKDGGNRKWICVQIPEETEESSEARKAGYETIADIAQERIRRAGEKIGKGDIGFKSYKLSSSNYRQWQILGEDTTEEELKEQMKLFIEQPLINGYNESDVVYEVAVKEGFSLNAKVEQGEVEGLPLWKITEDDHLTIVTFAKQLTLEQAEKLGLTKQDTHTLICLDSALTDSTKLNLARNFNLKVI